MSDHWNNRYAQFEELEGKKILAVEGLEPGSDYVQFVTDGGTFCMHHSQECCESVSVEEISGGEADDLIGQVVRSATESGCDPRDNARYQALNPDVCSEDRGDWAMEWTFYHIRTDSTSLTIRWYGTSNGYYSTSVAFQEEPTSEVAQEAT